MKLFDLEFRLCKYLWHVARSVRSAANSIKSYSMGHSMGNGSIRNGQARGRRLFGEQFIYYFLANRLLETCPEILE